MTTPHGATIPITAAVNALPDSAPDLDTIR
ncbi:hypothetical protein HNR10_000052 [Nocardiopsis aegyptia]|uniref:Uncharacterized protein n=1 Tax=Nocardiopsis aegyptia TaxID=220378 RepID=A0A7Z0EHN8_9ACTN|nr:hypothetical protein [Nocardiopsis aegyptia]